MDEIPIDALRAAVAARRPWMERTLRDIVAIPSISGSEQAVQSHMRGLLEELGFAVSEVPTAAETLTQHPGYSRPVPGHTGAASLFSDDLSRLTLGAHEHHGAATL